MSMPARTRLFRPTNRSRYAIGGAVLLKLSRVKAYDCTFIWHGWFISMFVFALSSRVITAFSWMVMYWEMSLNAPEAYAAWMLAACFSTALAKASICRKPDSAKALVRC